MPETFDPLWEYYVPDPEVEELFKMTGAIKGFEGIRQQEKRVEVLGFQFGNGNPNYTLTRLGRPKREREDTLESKKCPTCGNWFSPIRSSQVHCEEKCYIHKGRKKELEDVKCEVCMVVFRPSHWRQRYCSRDCGRKGYSYTHRGVVHDEEKLKEFRRMWENGESYVVMCARLQVSKPTLQRWKRQFGLKARPSWNHSKGRREEK